MIHIEFQDLDKLRKRYAPIVVDKALNSAINKTANKARTFISKRVREEYNVPAKKISQGLYEIRRSSPKDHIIERLLLYTGARTSLINFGGRQAKVRGSKHKGASVIVKRANGRKIVVGKYKHGGFVAIGKNGNRHIFERKTKKRSPIEKRTGPSVAQMIGTGVTLKAIDDFVKEEMPRQLEHELEYFLSKAGQI